MADPDELFRVNDEQSILVAARALIAVDENAALVTVDAGGQPRVRTVRGFLHEMDPADPQRSLTVWIMTRLSTRKLDQVRRDPRVTLYFNDDASDCYLSIMGVAVVHTDPDNEDAKAFYDQDYIDYFWPEFPSDFVMLQVRPHWIEFMGPGVPNHPETWRPQAIDFRAHQPR